jgi:hypothetical protein
MKNLSELRPGDHVNRHLFDLPAMRLFVLNVTDTQILCAATPDITLDPAWSFDRDPIWSFDRKTGREFEGAVGFFEGRAISWIEPET